MKTVEEWLEETLPEGLFKLAISNSTEETLKFETTNFSQALSAAFMWNKTPQGFTYWRKICKMYE